MEPMPDFSEPRLQHILGILIMWLNNLRKAMNAVFAGIAGVAIKPEWWWLIIALLLLFLLLLAVFSWLQYKRFTFHVEGDEFVIHKGVWVRERLAIPFERIQSVHLHQNVVQQVLKITGLKVDTAGSAGSELSIHALSWEEARALKSYLGRKKEGEVYENAADEVQEVAEQESGDLLVQVLPQNLLLLGITQNHLRNGLIAVAGIWGYAAQYERYLEQYAAEVDADWLDQMLANGLLLVVLGVVAFLLVSVAISMLQVFIAFFNFQANLGKRAFHLSGGLLKKFEYTVPLRKVQILEWRDNFLRRWAGFASARIFVTQSSDQVRKKQRIEIPFCYNRQRERVNEALGLSLDERASACIRPRKVYFWIRLIVPMLLAVAVGIVPALVYDHLRWLWAMVVAVPVAAGWAWKGYRAVYLKTDGVCLEMQRGWLFTRRIRIPWYKLQSINLKQNWVQQRRGTAHLHLYTAAGGRVVRFIPVSVAQYLYDFGLMKIEESVEEWM